jgi:hypothetical protein
MPAAGEKPLPQAFGLVGQASLKGGIGSQHQKPVAHGYLS